MVVSESGKRLKGSQNTSPDRAAKRQRASKPQAPSYEHVANSVLERVFDTRAYPDVCLRVEISKGIDALSREGLVPRFDETHLMACATVVRAANLWSLAWLY